MFDNFMKEQHGYTLNDAIHTSEMNVKALRAGENTKIVSGKLVS